MSLITLKTVGLVVLAAAIGGTVGYSQIFCPDGQCQITGSWYGGGIIGGLLGMVLAGSVVSSHNNHPNGSLESYEEAANADKNDSDPDSDIGTQ